MPRPTTNASSDPEFYYDRGNVNVKNRDYDKAISDYTEAIRLNPNFAAAYYQRGLAYYDKWDYDNAIADCSKAIKLQPNYAEAYYRRGMSYRRLPLNKDAQAQADFDKAKQLGYTGQ